MNGAGGFLVIRIRTLDGSARYRPRRAPPRAPLLKFEAANGSAVHSLCLTEFMAVEQTLDGATLDSKTHERRERPCVIASSSLDER
jgi:hypothetical protein